MELYERVRYVRKNILKMSMAEFGEKLGVSRDVINNIERNRLARPEQKLTLIKLIAKTFGLRESWLIEGEEPMFECNESFMGLNEWLVEKGAKSEDIPFLKAVASMFLSLSPEKQKIVKELMSDYIKKNIIKK